MDFYKCSKCGEIKPITDFSRDRTKKSGHKSQCKVCDYHRPGRAEYAKKYRAGHPEYFREKHAEYRGRNREKIKEQAKKYHGTEKTRAYYLANRERILENAHKWKKTLAGRTARSYYRAAIRAGDKSINLPALFDRDGGRCRICGAMCDYNDITVKNGAVIAGDNYPSIDHIVPISKGGTHEWSNVQLAHKRCNSVKSNN